MPLAYMRLAYMPLACVSLSIEGVECAVSKEGEQRYVTGKDGAAWGDGGNCRLQDAECSADAKEAALQRACADDTECDEFYYGDDI